jgi:hypothetical protein
LTAGGQRYEQPLVVTADPRASVPADVLAAKLELQKKIVAAMASSLGASEEVGEYRKQRKAAAGDETDASLAALEADLSKTNRTLGAILNQVEAADAPATAAQADTFRQTHDTLDAELARWKSLKNAS